MNGTPDCAFSPAIAVVAAQALTSVCLIDYRSMANFMDDKIPTAEAKMRQVLGLSGK